MTTFPSKHKSDISTEHGVSLASLCLQLDSLFSSWNWVLMSGANKQKKQWLFRKWQEYELPGALTPIM